MRLEPEHPSLAHLTFVAAIESYRMRLADDAPCDCRHGCTHIKTAATKRFRKALKTVMTSREVQRISGLAYDLRSYTGHLGSLFGLEKRFGYSPRLSLFNVAGDAVFDYMVLPELRNASRQVPGQGARQARLSRAVSARGASRGAPSAADAVVLRLSRGGQPGVGLSAARP